MAIRFSAIRPPSASVAAVHSKANSSATNRENKNEKTQKPEQPIDCRKGRKATGRAKEVFAIRLDPRLIASIKATGEDWPKLVAEILSHHFDPKPPV